MFRGFLDALSEGGAAAGAAECFEQAIEMTGRERVRRMFSRKDQDRIPRHDTFWAETIERWEREGLEGGYAGALDRLGSDFHSLCWSWPAPFRGGRKVLSEDAETQVVRDEWGAVARFWKHRSGTPEHVGFDCDSRRKWEEIYRPRLLAGGVQVDVDEARRQYQEGRRRGRWTHLCGAEAFEALRRLIGDEASMMAMIEDPEWVRDMAAVHTDCVLRDFQAILDAGVEPDGCWIFGDMAYNHSTVCSPQMYRELIWPEHKRMADWAHAHGMAVIYHTDGNVNGVVDLYVEAGFDALQPLEAKAGMDVRELSPRYGDRLAMMGNIDVMVMVSNDLERIEAEIAAKFAAAMATRGYAYHSDHSVPPTVSWETYRRMIELIDRYGRYT